MVVQIKNCSKSIFEIKVSSMKNTDNFHYEGKPSRAIAKLTPFAVSKDEWDTKEDTGKSTIKCTVRAAICQKARVTSNSEKIKPVALAVIELCLFEGISYSVSQSVSH